MRLPVGVIAGAHEGTALHPLEAARLALFFEASELIGRIVPHNRQVETARLQILADGHDVQVVGAQVVHHLQNLVPRLAQPDHDARFGERLGIHALGALEQFQAARVLRLRAHRAIETRHSLGVVVENFWLGVHHDLQRRPVALEVRDQHLDRAVRHQFVNPMQALGEDPGAAVGLLVAVDAGEHGMAQAHLLDRLGDAARFIRVERAGASRFDLAEATGSRAGVAHQQEGRGAAPPTFTDVGAHRLFADGVQALAAEERGQLAVFRAVGGAHAQPFGTTPARQVAVGRRRRFQCDRAEFVGGGGHVYA